MRAVCALCRSSQPLFIIFLHFSPAELLLSAQRDIGARRAAHITHEHQLIRPLHARIVHQKVLYAKRMKRQKIHFQRSMQKWKDF